MVSSPDLAASQTGRPLPVHRAVDVPYSARTHHQDSYSMGTERVHTITLSFGATRDFDTINLATKAKTRYSLESGDIFYFSPEFNDAHTHSIPKRSEKIGARISIVFFTSKPRF